MNTKNLLSYLVCFFLSVMLAYYINGTGGVMLCVCLIAAFLLSLLNFLTVGKNIEFDMQCDNTDLRKDEEFTVKITVRKKGFMPTPYVEIRLKASEKVEALKAEVFKTALFLNKKPLEITADYKTLFSGKAQVGIEYVRLTDYLGIFSRNIYSDKDLKNAVEIKILPNLPDTNTSSEILKSSCDAVAYDDNDEDTGETARFGSGVPGYEHREYVPGDPVKKINWKLSSKRDSYLIRLDEKVAVTSQIIVLDIFSNTRTGEQFKTNDILIEGSLSMLSSMLRRELKCDCWYYSENGGWQSFEVSNEQTLLEFQKMMAVYDDRLPRADRVPDSLTQEKGISVAIVFTNNLDLKVAEEGNTSLLKSFFATTEDSLKVRVDDTWIIDEHFGFKRI